MHFRRFAATFAKFTFSRAGDHKTAAYNQAWNNIVFKWLQPLGYLGLAAGTVVRAMRELPPKASFALLGGTVAAFAYRRGTTAVAVLAASTGSSSSPTRATQRLRSRPAGPPGPLGHSLPLRQLLRSSSADHWCEPSARGSRRPTPALTSKTRGPSHRSGSAPPTKRPPPDSYLRLKSPDRYWKLSS